MLKKDTRTDLVQECLKLPRSTTLDAFIAEAKAGEFHDFKNQKYDCGKVEAVSRLKSMDHFELANRVALGEFDEEPDEEDKARMRKYLLQDGAHGQSLCEILGLGKMI